MDLTGVRCRLVYNDRTQCDFTVTGSMRRDVGDVLIGKDDIDRYETAELGKLTAIIADGTLYRVNGVHLDRLEALPADEAAEFAKTYHDQMWCDFVHPVKSEAAAAPEAVAKPKKAAKPRGSAVRKPATRTSRAKEALASKVDTATEDGSSEASQSLASSVQASGGSPPKNEED